MPVQAILTDIEGTTSSIHFVKQVLFPYAAHSLPAFIEQHADEDHVANLLMQAAAEAGLDAADRAAIIAQLLQWIEQDRKITPLKALQGLIWEQGYRQGVFKGHLYADAYRRLCEWYEQGIPLYVYSSGSVYAQKLFFTYSDYGDITDLFSGHFDTQTGPKKSADSYREIARLCQLPPVKMLFLSDIAEELDAAVVAGMQTCQLVREQSEAVGGNAGSHSRHSVVYSFAEIVIPLA